VLDFLGSPRFVEFLMAGVIVEGAVLIVYRRRTGRGMAAREVASFLGAGLALLLAMRALGPPAEPGDRTLFAAAMTAALGFHLWHVAQRWNV
jgi:hypothetical protein